MVCHNNSIAGSRPRRMVGAAVLTLAVLTVTASNTPAAAQAPHYRADPLRPWWDTRPIQPSVLAYVTPVRVAIANSAVKPHQPPAEPAAKPMRMIGFVTGPSVYALLVDVNGSALIVRPGQLLPDGTRVLSIDSAGVALSTGRELAR